MLGTKFAERLAVILIAAAFVVSFGLCLLSETVVIRHAKSNSDMKNTEIAR